jgi:glycogen operon protein
MALMMLSAGVPMMTGGDEVLRTQFGNNNAYNLDSSANWLFWTRDSVEANHETFSKRLIAFRKAHPALRPAGFYASVDNNGNVMEQLRWFKPDGALADATYFNSSSNHALAWRIDGSEFGDSASAIYVAYNGWSAQVDFTLPWPGNGKQWYRVTDTATWNEGANTFVAPGSEALIGGEWTVYGLQARSLLVLIAK